MGETHPIRVVFQYTPDEWRDVLAAAQRSVTKLPRLATISFVGGVIALILLASLAAFYLLKLDNPRPLLNAQTRATAVTVILVTLGTSFALLVWLIVFARALLQSSSRVRLAPEPSIGSANRARRVLFALAPWFLALMVFCILPYVMPVVEGRSTVVASEQATAPKPRTSPAVLVVFLIVFLAVWALLFTWMRGVRRKQVAELLPRPTRTQTFEANQTGVHWSDMVSSSQLSWHAFTRCWETGNLFLLDLGSANLMAIPKRAFASIEDLNAYRELLARSVGDRQRSI